MTVKQIQSYLDWISGDKKKEGADVNDIKQQAKELNIKLPRGYR